MTDDREVIDCEVNDLDWYARVAAWNRKAGLEVNETPLKLIYLEYKQLWFRWDLVHEEYTETKAALHKRDIVAVADGIGDTIVTLLGLASYLGIDMRLVMTEILKSNDTKLIGSVKHDATTGKVLKGPEYQAPDIAGALEMMKDPACEPACDPDSEITAIRELDELAQRMKG